MLHAHVYHINFLYSLHVSKYIGIIIFHKKIFWAFDTARAHHPPCIATPTCARTVARERVSAEGPRQTAGGGDAPAHLPLLSGLTSRSHSSCDLSLAKHKVTTI